MKTKKLAFRGPRHILARVICLLLAVIFWLYVMYAAAPPYDATYQNVAVTVINSDNVAYTAVVDPIASVRVSGPKIALADCTSEDLVATVSLSDLENSKEPLYVDKTCMLKVSFTTPDGITVEGDYTVSVILKAKLGAP